MIIRSQDKTTITNFQNVTDIVANYEGENVIEIIAYLAGEGRTHLGRYSTEEKAIKVLDMIQDTYLSRMELDGGYDMVHGCYVQPNYWVLPKVFQMPQDSEV